MKNSLNIALLGALALALLLVAQPAAAGGDGEGCATEDGALAALAATMPVASELNEARAGKPTQNIVNGPCSWCNSNSSCSTPCIDENGNDDICSNHACDPCREALVEISRTLIGRKAKTVFWGRCEYKWHYNVSYRSVNSPSCQIYTYCETETESQWENPLNLYCCDHHPGGACFGQTC